MPIVVVRWLLVVFVFLSSFPLAAVPARAQAADAAAAQLPSNIQVSALLDPVVVALLRKSPSFRRQCARIADARFARISIVAVPTAREFLSVRARSVITRHLYGALRAVIEIPIAGGQVELIGHELEHVIEQIEGLNLPELARSRDGSVVEVQDGVYETERAKAAGRAIAAEALGEPVAGRQVANALRGVGARLTREAPSPTWLLRR